MISVRLRVRENREGVCGERDRERDRDRQVV